MSRIVGAAVLVLMSGCAGADGAAPSPSPVAADPPCDGAPLAAVDLGSPTRGGPTAQITTTGESVWFTFSGASDGLFSGSRPRVAAIYLGPAKTPPTYDEARSTVAPTLLELRVAEDQHARLDLPAGSYWVWSSVSSYLRVVGCEEGSVSGTPAPPLTG